MRKYVKGKWKVKANKERFEEVVNLKHKVQLVAGFYQNDMTITDNNLEILDKEIDEIVMTLKSSFEGLLSELGENLSPCKHENVEKCEDFCPHKGLSYGRICKDCGESL